MPRLPPELEQRVARWCPANEYLAMMLLDRASYFNIINSFYKNVLLTSTAQFDIFSDTMLSDRTLAGRTSLQLKPRGFVITIGSSYNTPDPYLILDVLRCLPNLKDMRLQLPSRCLSQLFGLKELSRITFKLRTLYCNMAVGVFRFLNTQANLELLDIIPCITSASEALADVEPAASGFLPALQSLRGSQDVVCKLASGRPISAISISQLYGTIVIKPVADAMNQATVPLRRFTAATRPDNVPGITRFSVECLENLAHAHHSLENFQIWMLIGPCFELLRRPSSEVFPFEIKDLLVALKPFKSLRVLSITTPEMQKPPNVKLDDPQLMRWECWKQACPSLRLVRIFEEVLSED